MPRDYIPTPGPLPGVQYEPSNGTEGECFILGWCCKCARDLDCNGTVHAEGREASDDDWCPILAASFRGEAVEWREIPMGQPIPTPKCQHTPDLFGGLTS